jgi:hypothetical protein
VQQIERPLAPLVLALGGLVAVLLVVILIVPR